MTLSVAELDALPEMEAASRLAACCGSSKWVAGMIARRPFGSREALFAAADDAARSLAASDWLEAFSHHPRIGERTAAAAVSTDAASWSAGEQGAAAAGLRDVQYELADANREYAERFGFIFIICASGRTAAEILAALRERMHNAPGEELAVAAREQELITRLRLARLLS